MKPYAAPLSVATGVGLLLAAGLSSRIERLLGDVALTLYLVGVLVGFAFTFSALIVAGAVVAQRLRSRREGR